MRCHRQLTVVLGVSFMAFSAVARADFTPPKDGKLTEKQVTSYIAVLKEQMDAVRSSGEAAKGAGGAASMAIVANMEKKVDDAITKSGLTKD